MGNARCSDIIKTMQPRVLSPGSDTFTVIPYRGNQKKGAATTPGIGPNYTPNTRKSQATGCGVRKRKFGYLELFAVCGSGQNQTTWEMQANPEMDETNFTNLSKVAKRRKPMRCSFVQQGKPENERLGYVCLRAPDENQQENQQVCRFDVYWPNTSKELLPLQMHAMGTTEQQNVSFDGINTNDLNEQADFDHIMLGDHNADNVQRILFE